MPFLTAPFQLRLQESFDKDAPNYSAPTEGELDAYGNPSIPHLWATAWSEATEAGAKGLNATTVNTPWIVQCGTLLTSWFMTGMLIPTPAGAAMYAPPSNWL